MVTQRQNQVRVRKGLFEMTVYHWRISAQELKAGSGGRNWSGNHGGMLLAGLLCMTCSAFVLSQPKPIWPGVLSPTPIRHQENSSQRHHRPISWKRFLDWASLFPDISRFALSSQKKNPAYKRWESMKIELKVAGSKWFLAAIVVDTFTEHRHTNCVQLTSEHLFMAHTQMHLTSKCGRQDN